MPLTHEQIGAMQAECLADDIEILGEMCEWSEAQVRAYFESGGAVRAAALVGSAVESAEGDGDVVEIGGVSLPVRRDIAAPALVPWGGGGEGVPAGLDSQGSLGAVRWMMMQILLGQDMLLHADPV
jgi:hypothetical protein